MSGSGSSATTGTASTGFLSAKDSGAEKEILIDSDDVFEHSDSSANNNPYGHAQKSLKLAKAVSESLSTVTSTKPDDVLWRELPKGAKIVVENSNGVLYMERYQSFIYSNWPYDLKRGNLCHPKALALAGLGFSSLEPTPTAQCQICLTVFENLEPNSNPWILHSEINSECYLVQLGQRSEVDDYSVTEIMQMAYQRIINIAEHKVKEKEKNIKKKLYELKQVELERQQPSFES